MANDFIVGFHRSRKLAERHAKRSKLRIVSRRNSKGRLSKWGHFFYFTKAELTRYTVGITFPIKEKYGSVLATLYTSKWTERSKSKRRFRDEGATREAAVVGLERATNYERNKFWFDLEGATSVELSTAPYDSKFAETIRVISEIPNKKIKPILYRRK